MRIVVFASLTEDTTANYIIRALKRCEHLVYVFSDITNPLTDYLIEGTADAATLCDRLFPDPDLFFFIEGGSMQVFPTGLEKLKCITAFYGIDTHMDYMKHVAITKVFDVNFVAQYEFVERLQSNGAKQVYWLPLAFEPKATGFASRDRDLLISYVGSDNAKMHKERHALIEAITERFPSTYFGRAKPREMSEIYARSLLVFNKSVNNDVNMRYFEAMGEGAVLLTDPIRNNGLESLFVEGEHYIVYRDKEHLLEIIESLSKDRDRIKSIGQNAEKHILAYHTYDHRAKDICETILLSRKVTHVNQMHYLEVFIALNLIPQALRSFKLVLKSLNVSQFNSLLVNLIILVLNFTSAVVMSLLYFKAMLRKYRWGK
ncbi:glycosyltransferase [Arcticibacter sp. MXS-1]|uniref:glycosyltransferase family protein n=1 Tax=Arcticibacter sp. MXS-1 TaxID=3341726 RepID=UPI0035A8A751